MLAKIFDVERGSVVDGPGIRTTVFFKGCNLHCAWCHNPESQDKNTQMLFYKDKCTGCGKCKEKCPNSLESCIFCGRCELYCPNNAREICGKDYTLQELTEEILKDKSYFEGSNGGVTFSGGECMLQIDFLQKALMECKRLGISTAVDTAGHVPYEYFERIIPYTDIFLYDVKCFDSSLHKKFTGVDNLLILENLKKLILNKRRIWIRIPVIPTVNDTESEMIKIRRFIESFGTVERIQLLPYHTMGEGKYAAIGKMGRSFSVPNSDTIHKLSLIFE